MSTGISTLIFRLVVVLVWSWVFYIFDRAHGKKWYRVLYNFTHEQKLAPEVERGFVLGRDGKTKCKVALFVCLKLLVIGIFVHPDTALTWVVTFLCAVPICIVGFVTGPIAANTWSKRDRLFKKIDQIEAGEIDPVKTARERGHKFWQWLNIITWPARIKNFVSEFWSGEAPVVGTPQEPTAGTPGEDGATVPFTSTAPKAEEPEQGLNPQDAINRFTSGG